MGLPLKNDLSILELSKTVSQMINKESGNILGEAQITMVSSRMSRRLLELGGISPSEYMNILNNNHKEELNFLVGLLTTHHTFFFREFIHFEYLLKDLPSVIASAKSRGEKTIRIYSAACSRGHEVYSLAIFLAHHLPKIDPSFDFKIIGTDIDPQSVNFAKNGVYSYKEVISSPKVYLDGNWQKGTGDIAQFAKIKDFIKKHCEFYVENILSPNSSFHKNKYDYIFCRNVFIYFDKPTIKKVADQFKTYLHKQGKLITGLSESIKDHGIELKAVGPNVYSFNLSEEINKTGSVEIPHIAATPFLKASGPIRILCVDDSSSILKLLTKIFSNDSEFTLVGTALNGLEAQEFLKKNKVDAMTLDIHMPEMDGVEYLKNNFGPKHPPVIVISSAGREDTTFAQKTLEYGASDFVEKPALNNINERAEEIKAKIKMAIFNKNSNNVVSFDRDFRNNFEIKDCDKKARIIFSSFSDLPKIKKLLSSLSKDHHQPPVCLLFEGNDNLLELIKKEISLSSHFPSEIAPKNFKALEKNKIYIIDFNSNFDTLSEVVKGKKISMSIFGICSKNVEKKITHLGQCQLLLEDIKGVSEDLKKIASDLFPWTSFSHVATEYLAKD